MGFRQGCEKIQRRLRTFEKPITVFIGAACLSSLLLNFDFSFLEAGLYDFRVVHGFQKKPDPEIVLITLDDKTAKDLGGFVPLSLDYHSHLLQAMSDLDPKAVGYLVDMNHVHQINPEFFTNGTGKLFVSAANHLMEKGIIFLMGTPFDVIGEALPPPPLNTLPHAIAVVHQDGNVFSEDRVTRRALLSIYDTETFHMAMARGLEKASDPIYPPGTFELPEVNGKYFFFRYHGSPVLRHDGSGGNSYTRYSFNDILEKRIPLGALKNKIVLVGTLASDDSADFSLTPYSKTPFTNPKIVLHANILDSVLHKDGVIRVHPWLNAMTTVFVTCAVFWWIMTLTPLYGVFATISLVLVFMIASQLIFQIQGIWLRESQPLVGIFVSYYLAVPYRLIREYKKRWDYQRKNELLTQLEELKTNFLSLITHDLKTPVARIQGLTEMLIRRTSTFLGEVDQTTLRHIFNATDELNHFISSVLELNRIESDRIQLHFESKDLNQLIERAADSFQTQAAARKIQLKLELEPLFPLRMDASLISKVINNLIDNALKYSNPGSEIQIRSYEEDELVIVSVKDQGIGMSPDELAGLFTRFYRAKNQMTASISGTGLGLYLTRYFIEAHQGRVEVESESGRGSIFKILLPLKPRIQAAQFNFPYIKAAQEPSKENLYVSSARS